MHHYMVKEDELACCYSLGEGVTNIITLKQYGRFSLTKRVSTLSASTFFKNKQGWNFPKTTL